MSKTNNLDACEELTIEEKYTQAVQEAKVLKEQIEAANKAQAAYEIGLTVGKSIMAIVEGLIDAGLSRKEAFGILKFSTEMVK